MKHIHNILLYCLLNIPILSAHATPRDIGEGLTGDSNSKILENINNHYGLWSGIGRLTNSSGERCTAALIDTRNKEGKAIGPAYLITSGHCVFAEYGTARINENFDARITFNYFHDVPEQHKTSSGSPMLDRRTNQIVSIYSKSGLTTDWGHSDNRHTSKTNYSYSASFLRACFIEGFFKPDTESCALQPVDIANETPWLRCQTLAWPPMAATDLLTLP